MAPTTTSNSTSLEGNQLVGQKQEYKLINRVTTYPIVTSIWDSAKGYYSTAKEKSPLVKYGCETIENNLEKGIQWVGPKVEPVLQTELLKKYSEPILAKVDKIGCRQLDNIENASEKFNDSYQISKNMLEIKVNDIKATTMSLVEVGKHALEDKIVPPVDNYLKHSLLGVPITMALDYTEKVCDRMLPEKKESHEETKEETKSQELVFSEGPLLRTGKLSLRIQRQAFIKLKGIALRSPEKINAMKFSVDLIQYAASQIDSGVKATNQFIGKSVHKGVEKSSSTVKAVNEKRKRTVKEVKNKLNVVGTEAIHALSIAVEVLSKQVPTPIANLSHQTLESFKERTKGVVLKIESTKDVRNFNTIAKNSLAKLQEATALLTAYVNSTATKTEAMLPPHLVATVTNSIHAVVDLLSTVVVKRKQSQENLILEVLR